MTLWKELLSSNSQTIFLLPLLPPPHNYTHIVGHIIYTQGCFSVKCSTKGATYLPRCFKWLSYWLSNIWHFFLLFSKDITYCIIVLFCTYFSVFLMFDSFVVELFKINFISFLRPRCPTMKHRTATFQKHDLSVWLSASYLCR
jgi:hypothetical protein